MSALTELLLLSWGRATLNLFFMVKHMPQSLKKPPLCFHRMLLELECEWRSDCSFTQHIPDACHAAGGRSAGMGSVHKQGPTPGAPHKFQAAGEVSSHKANTVQDALLSLVSPTRPTSVQENL